MENDQFSADIRNEKSTEEVFLEEKRKFCGLFIINNIKKNLKCLLSQLDCFLFDITSPRPVNT